MFSIKPKFLICSLSFITTGAIFSDEQKGSATETAFKYAIHQINRDPKLLPNTTLVYDLQYVESKDSFHAGKKGKQMESVLNQLHYWI